MRAIRDRVPKRTIVVRTGNKPIGMNPCVFYRENQRAYRVWSSNRTQADWEEYKVARSRAQRVYVEAERAFNERSRALLTNAPTRVAVKNFSTIPIRWLHLPLDRAIAISHSLHIL